MPFWPWFFCLSVWPYLPRVGTTWFASEQQSTGLQSGCDVIQCYCQGSLWGRDGGVHGHVWDCQGPVPHPDLFPENPCWWTLGSLLLGIPVDRKLQHRLWKHVPAFSIISNVRWRKFQGPVEGREGGLCAVCFFYEGLFKLKEWLYNETSECRFLRRIIY